MASGEGGKLISKQNFVFSSWTSPNHLISTVQIRWGTHHCIVQLTVPISTVLWNF